MSGHASSSDGNITFLVMLRIQHPVIHNKPYIVRAASVAGAYREVMAQDPTMLEMPAVSFEVHVLGDAALLPAAEKLARAYWDAGRQAEANPNHDSTFEDYWAEHGAYPWEED